MNRLRALINRLTDGIHHPDAELTRLQRAVRFAYELARYGARELLRDRAPQMAAALSYRTIFSLVPVLVLALVTLQAVMGQDGIRDRLDQVMAWAGLDELEAPTPAAPAAEAASGSDPGEPGAEAAVGGEPGPADPEATSPGAVVATLSEVLDDAVQRVTGINYGAITIVGIGLFIYAAISLIIQVEESFNTVYGAPRGRSMLWRLTSYWTLLTLGPIAIYASFSVGVSSGDVVERLPTWLGWAVTPVRWGLKTGVTWLLLLVAYVLMPNTRVKLRCAAIGAGVAAVLWEVGKAFLTHYVQTATGGALAVYGSLALVPLFLFWVYVTWLIVLFGLEVSYILQTVQRARISERQRQEAESMPVVEPATALIVIAEIARAFDGGTSRSARDVAEVSGVSEAVAERLLQAIAAEGIVHRVSDGRAHDEARYALARPPASVRASDVLDALKSLAPSPRDPSASTLLDALRDRQRRAMGDLDLASLAAQAAPAARTTPA